MVVEVKGFSDLTDIMIIDLAVQEEWFTSVIP